jgi:hypothetical protein
MKTFRLTTFAAVGVVAIAVACVLLRLAQPATVSNPTVAPGTVAGTHEITWRVTPVGNDDPIVDFHLLTGKWKLATATLLGPGDGGNPDKWNKSKVTGGTQSKRGYHWNNPTKDNPVDANGSPSRFG